MFCWSDCTEAKGRIPTPRISMEALFFSALNMLGDSPCCLCSVFLVRFLICTGAADHVFFFSVFGHTTGFGIAGDLWTTGWALSVLQVPTWLINLSTSVFWGEKRKKPWNTLFILFRIGESYFFCLAIWGLVSAGQAIAQQPGAPHEFCWRSAFWANVPMLIFPMCGAMSRILLVTVFLRGISTRLFGYRMQI